MTTHQLWQKSDNYKWPLAFKRKYDNDDRNASIFLKITYVLHRNISHVCEKFGKDRPNIKKAMAIFRIARRTIWVLQPDRPR